MIDTKSVILRSGWRGYLGSMWKAFWQEINTPSDFEADPYGELTNQCAHAFFGLILAVVFCFSYLAWWGEYPHKEVAGVVVTLPYLLGELFEQRWRGWDTVADVFFYAIGGYGVLAALTEVKLNGTPFLSDNIPGFAFCLAAFIIVLFLRLRPRVRAKYGAK
jgi:hypothetical protein